MRLTGFRNLPVWKNIAKEAIQQTTIVTKFLCLLHLTDTYIGSSVLVYGPSMFPTLNHTGDVVLVEKISTRLGNVSVGDIVLVRSLDNPNRTMSKRILGLEGDRVTFVVDPVRSEQTATVEVPKGHVWIQGDNIYASRDSRNFGPVPYSLLQGRVFARIWPLHQFGSLNHGIWQ